MAAIVRVKRSRSDNRANTIVVSCKRAKLDKGFVVDEKDDVQGVFKFAATVDKRAGEVTSCVKEAIKKEKLQRELKHHSSTSGVLQKARGQHKQQIVSSRFKLLTEKRAVDLNGLDIEQENVPQTADGAKGPKSVPDPAATSVTSECRFRLLDVALDRTSDMTLAPPPAPKSTEDLVTCNNVPMIREKVPSSKSPENADYVYDIYYLNQSDFDFRALENILAIEATREELVYDDYREEDEEIYDDEDNADDENNWRNDYPDEDPQYCEHWDKDYDFDELGGRDFSYDDWGTSQMLRDRLKLTEDNYSDHEDLSSSEDQTYFSEPMHPVEVSSALESYEQYKERLNSQIDTDTGQ